MKGLWKGLSAVGVDLLRVWAQQLHPGGLRAKWVSTAIVNRIGNWKISLPLIAHPLATFGTARENLGRVFWASISLGVGRRQKSESSRNQVTCLGETWGVMDAVVQGLLSLCKLRLGISGQVLWKQEIYGPPRYTLEKLCVWKHVLPSEPHLGWGAVAEGLG